MASLGQGGSPQPQSPSPWALPAQGTVHGAVESRVAPSRQRVLPDPSPIPLPGTLLLTSLGWVGREQGQRRHVARLLLVFMIRTLRSGALGRRAAAVRTEAGAGSPEAAPASAMDPVCRRIPGLRLAAARHRGPVAMLEGTSCPAGWTEAACRQGNSQWRRGDLGVPPSPARRQLLRRMARGGGAGSPADPRRLGTACHHPSLQRARKTR